jgi:aryl-alcohol dehydrogenase-like predicted oxidoreductase
MSRGTPARWEDAAPIPGTTRRRYLEENVAARAGSLSADDLQTIDRMAPQGIAASPRYPEGGMRAVNA